MNYGLCKKLTFLLAEFYYKSDIMLEKDLCQVINELENQDWYDLRMNFDDCMTVLQNLPSKFKRKPYGWVNDVENFIEYLEYLPVEIAEEQAERQIACSEALGDFIYENGYDEVIKNGFGF